MGNFCSCLNIDKRKHVVSVIGLLEDVKSILVYIIPGFNADKEMKKFTEFVFDYNGMTLVIHVHIISSMIKSLIKLHFSSESAIIYAINADNNDSIDSARLLIDDEEVKMRKDVITVLCRGKYLDNPQVESMRQELNGNIHKHLSFYKFDVKDIEKVTRQALDDICDKLNY